MKYIIGVDGGGTKTEAVAYNIGGLELGRGLAGFGNMILGEALAIQNIIRAVEECISSVEKTHFISECIMIYIGAAGINSGRNREILEEGIRKKFGVRVKAVNDAEIALAALLRGEDGVLTISGTGSISYGVKKGVMARAGGWGHILGDEGSGYYIALEAFKNMAREDDMGLKPGSLSRAIMGKLQIEEVNGIKGFIYSAQKGEIADFAPIVVKEAESGDSIALGILEKAGRDLAETTMRVCRKLKFRDNVKIGVRGSILTHVNIVRQEFEKHLKSEIRDLQIIDNDVSSAKGGYYLAMREDSCLFDMIRR